MKCFLGLLPAYLMFLFNQIPEYENHSTAIIEQFRTEILEPNNMKICSIGGSSDKGIKMIHLGVNVPGIRNIEQSRRILVDLVEQLLRLYNENEQIRPFLLDYPFIISNLEFEISLVSKQNSFIVYQVDEEAGDQITYVTMRRGNVRYNIYTGEKISPLKLVLSESYQEALKKVRSEKFQ